MGMNEEKQEIKKTADEWCKVHHVKVLDPDGWRNARRSWYDLLTEIEFRTFLAASTVEFNHAIFT